MDKTDKFEWSVGDKQVYPIDYTQEEPHEADTKKGDQYSKNQKLYT